MGPVTRRAVFWIPRIGTLLFAAFVSLFAFDVFSEGYGPLETVVALLIHLVPTFVILGALVVAWKREWVGAILFVGVAAFFVLLGGGSRPEWWWYLVFVLPPLAVSALFLASWRMRSTGSAGA